MRGIGASHQTGWTGLIGRVIQINGALTGALLEERDVERLALKLGQGQSASDE